MSCKDTIRKSITRAVNDLALDTALELYELGLTKNEIVWLVDNYGIEILALKTNKYVVGKIKEAYKSETN